MRSPTTVVMVGSNGKVHTGLAAPAASLRPACDGRAYWDLTFRVLFAVPEQVQGTEVADGLRQRRVKVGKLCGRCFAKWWRDEYERGPRP